MAKDPFEQFAIPNEMRSLAEQSVAQARQPLTGSSRRQTRPWGGSRGRPRRRAVAPRKSRKNR